jgi:hypothetical protein
MYIYIWNKARQVVLVVTGLKIEGKAPAQEIDFDLHAYALNRLGYPGK